MDIWKPTSIARDLEDYVKLIKKHEVDALFNVSELSKVASELIDKENCEIDSVEVEFYKRNPVSKMVPKLALFKLNLINSLTINSNFDLGKNDPVEKCTFDLIITGFCAYEDGVTYKAAWHLDKDIGKDKDGDHKYTHPLYHFQHGGWHMDSLETGQTLLMGAPRIPHPPMDIFLSIHFILNNYFNKEEDAFSCIVELSKDAEYIDILERAKERMWYPYFKGLNDRIKANTDLNLANLFPLAV